MSEGDDCVFCRIVAGDIPASILAGTEAAVAFRDVAPVAPTHVLVVSRAHLKDATSLGPEDAALVLEMLDLARQTAEAEGIDESGYRLVFNVGSDAGNTVPHLHLHVIGGRAMEWPPG